MAPQHPLLSTDREHNYRESSTRACDRLSEERNVQSAELSLEGELLTLQMSAWHGNPLSGSCILKEPFSRVTELNTCEKKGHTGRASERRSNGWFIDGS